MNHQPCLKEYRGASHIHSTYSDGSSAIPAIIADAKRAGLDFIVMSDHNSLEPKYDGWEGWHDGVLVIIGVETSPWRKGHCIAFGLEQHRNFRWMEPHECLDEVNRQGGFAFIAHPMGKKLPAFKVNLEAWRDWDKDGFAGIELWSYMHDWIEGLNYLKLWSSYREPEARIKGPDPRLLRIWDELTRTRKVAAISGLDAHARPIFGWWCKVFPYFDLFRTLRTHILCKPLTGDARHDLAQIFDAHREGRCFVAYDLLADSDGFRFHAESGPAKAVMGESLTLDREVRFSVSSPETASLRLLRHGETVAETKGTTLEATASDKGAYRVEARLHDKPWVFTNPIYVS